MRQHRVALVAGIGRCRLQPGFDLTIGIKQQNVQPRGVAGVIGRRDRHGETAARQPDHVKFRARVGDIKIEGDGLALKLQHSFVRDHRDANHRFVGIHLFQIGNDKAAARQRGKFGAALRLGLGLVAVDTKDDLIVNTVNPGGRAKTVVAQNNLHLFVDHRRAHDVAIFDLQHVIGRKGQIFEKITRGVVDLRRHAGRPVRLLQDDVKAVAIQRDDFTQDLIVLGFGGRRRRIGHHVDEGTFKAGAIRVKEADKGIGIRRAVAKSRKLGPPDGKAAARKRNGLRIGLFEGGRGVDLNDLADRRAIRGQDTGKDAAVGVINHIGRLRQHFGPDRQKLVVGQNDQIRICAPFAITCGFNDNFLAGCLQLHRVCLVFIL